MRTAIARAMRVLAPAALALGVGGCGDLQLVRSGPVPPSPAMAVAVRPGDVVHVTTWVYGRPDGNNDRPPSIEVVRLPIRLVPPGPTPDGAASLSPEEAAFLGDVIGTRRVSHVQSDVAAAELSAQLNDNRNDLWNALVGSLRLIADQPDAFAQLRVVAQDDHSGDDGRHALSPFCKVVARLDQVLAHVQICTGEDAEASAEARTLRAYPKPLQPLSERKATEVYDGFSRRQLVIAATGDLERAAVRIDGTSGSEARWSLAAWERSGICREEGGGAWSIRRVELRTGTGTRRLRMVADDGRPEFRVLVQRGEREVRRDKDGRHGTLAHGALASLYPADLRWIEWGDAGRPVRDAAVTAEVRAMCLVTSGAR